MAKNIKYASKVSQDNRIMVDAIRQMLGLSPLFISEIKLTASEHWAGHAQVNAVPDSKNTIGHGKS